MVLSKAIETARLSISALTAADAPFVQRLVNEPGWLTYIGDRNVHSVADAERYLREGPIASYELHGHGLYRVALRESDTPIGICGLIRRESLPAPDLGYALLREFEGQGYAREAAEAVLDHGSRVLGMVRILAIVMPGNARSISLLRRLGFVAQDRQLLSPDASGDAPSDLLFEWRPTHSGV